MQVKIENKKSQPLGLALNFITTENNRLLYGII